MKFGVHLLQAGPRTDGATILHMARMVEEFGYDSVWLFDHLINPVATTGHYPGNVEGEYPAEVSFPYYDAVALLGALAVATQRVRLGTRVLVPILRPPVVLAKELTTIDSIAGGRLVLGVGTGWMPEEFEAVGVSMDRRLARLDEHVALMRNAWERGVSKHDGEFYRHAEAGFFPQPPQPGNHIPVLLGGVRDVVLRRVARYADGWAAFSPPEEGRDTYDLMPADILAERLAVLRRYCDEAGRDFAELQIVTGGRLSNDPKLFQAHADLGVTTCALVSFAPPEAIIDKAAAFAKSVGLEL